MTDKKETKLIPLEKLVSSKLNSRKIFNEQEIKELSESIAEVGLINNINVRPIPETDKYEIVAGERRKRAYILLNKKEIPSDVYNYTDDEADAIQLAENIQRKELSIMEEAEALKKLHKSIKSFEKVAEKVNKSIPYVLGRIELLSLIPQIKKKVNDETIPAPIAVTISRYNEEAQKAIYGKFFQHNEVDVPTKKALMDFISNDVHIPLNNAPFDLEDKILNKKMGACTDCHFNTGYGQSLFNDITEESCCTKGSCYHLKVKSHLQNRINEIVKDGKNAVLLSLKNFYSYYGNDFSPITEQMKGETKLNLKDLEVFRAYNFEPAKENDEGAFYALVIHSERNYTGSRLEVGDELWVKRVAQVKKNSGPPRLVDSDVPTEENPIEQRERRMNKRFARENDLDKIEVRKIILKEISMKDLPVSESLKYEIAQETFFSISNNLMILKLYNVKLTAEYENEETGKLDRWRESERKLFDALYKTWIKTDNDLLLFVRNCFTAKHLEIMSERNDVNISNPKHNRTGRLIEIANEYQIPIEEIHKPYIEKRTSERVAELDALVLAKMKFKEKEKEIKSNIKALQKGKTIVLDSAGTVFPEENQKLTPGALKKVDVEILKKVARKIGVKVPKEPEAGTLANEIHSTLKAA